MADATTEMILRVEADVDKAKKQLDGLSRSVDNVDGKAKKTKLSLKDMIPSGATIAMGAAGLAAAGLTKAISELMAREDALADFSAITGVTGEKLNEFGDAAENLSNKFGTGVVENIEAFKGVLSRLGPDFAQSSEAVALMGDNINTLAKASGLDATQSMDALTTAMLQFGVDLSDPMQAAGVATEMMNTMAAGAKEGAAEIPQIAQALTVAGTSAKAAGLSFEETNAAIQVLATGGLYGAEAGTALRNVLVRLQAPTEEAKKVMNKFGIDARSVANTLTRDGLEAAVRQLGDRFDKIKSPVDKAMLLNKMFGEQAQNAAAMLMQQNEQLGSLTGKLTGTSTAYDQAAVKMSTSSERMKRTMNAAWNDIVKGVGAAAKGLGETFDYLFTSMEKTINEISMLLSLDFSGWWDSATKSVGQYNQEREKQIALEEKNYRLLSQQADKQIADTKKFHQMQSMISQLYIDLQKEGKKTNAEMVKMKDTFKEMFLAGKVSSLQEFYISLTNQADEAAAKAAEAADAAKKQKTEEQQRAESELRNMQNKKITIDLLHKTEEQANETRDALIHLADGLGWNVTNAKEFDRALSKIAVSPYGKLVEDTTLHIQNMSESWYESEEAAKTAGDAFNAIFSTMGAAVQGGSDALKEGLKSILVSILDFINAEFIAAGAAVAIRALISGGLSLFADTSGYLLASAGLAAARSAVASFRTGIDYVPRDAMPAILHKGEKVLTNDEADEYRKGNKTSASTVKIAFTRFETAIEGNHINRSRRYA